MRPKVFLNRSARGAAPLIALACALCAVAVALLPAPAVADPVKVLRFGEGDLSSLRAEAADVRAQIARLDREAQVAVEKYDAARADLDEVSTRLTEMRRELDTAQARLDTAQQALSRRLASMYKSESLTLLDALLNARDIADVDTQIDHFRLVSQADRTNVDDVQALTHRVALITGQLERDREAALDKETELDALRVDIEDQVAQRRVLLGTVNRRIAKLLARQRAEAEATARRLAGDVDLGTIVGTDAQLAVVRETMRWLGVPYVWGGATPSCFDCSGLVLYVFAKFGVKLPHAATYQARLGTPVPFDLLQPADLVFFGSPSFYHHVGSYIGNGLFIEAPHTGDVVKVSVLAGRGAALACRYPLRLR
jgi:peptidoglycan hydrolase CwlO-like protein